MKDLKELRNELSMLIFDIERLHGYENYDSYKHGKVIRTCHYALEYMDDILHPEFPDVGSEEFKVQAENDAAADVEKKWLKSDDNLTFLSHGNDADAHDAHWEGNTDAEMYHDDRW